MGELETIKKMPVNIFSEDLFDSEVLYYEVPLATWGNLKTDTSGSGSAGASSQGHYVRSGTTSGSNARIHTTGRMENTDQTPPHTWDRRNMMKVVCGLPDDSDLEGLIGAGEGAWDGDFTRQHAGFYIKNDEIHMSVADGSTHNHSQVRTFTGGDVFTFKFKHYPGDRVEFWIDGTKEGELTSNLPSGTRYRGSILTMYITNTAGVDRHIEFADELWFLQLED